MEFKTKFSAATPFARENLQKKLDVRLELISEHLPYMKTDKALKLKNLADSLRAELEQLPGTK